MNYHQSSIDIFRVVVNVQLQTRPCLLLTRRSDRFKYLLADFHSEIKGAVLCQSSSQKKPACLHVQSIVDGLGGVLFNYPFRVPGRAFPLAISQDQAVVVCNAGKLLQAVSSVGVVRSMSRRCSCDSLFLMCTSDSFKMRLVSSAYP